MKISILQKSVVLFFLLFVTGFVCAGQMPHKKKSQISVFLVLLENKGWFQIYQNKLAPYINEQLLPKASYTGHYYVPIHPSLPNYLILESGTSFGVRSDVTPATFHTSTPRHLVTLLDHAGYSWKSYQEDITGKDCPLQNSKLYATKHNPMVYFDDVTNSNNPKSRYCIQHIRPYSELDKDLKNSTVADYNFITPNMCHDMHDCSIAVGDRWLAEQMPKILQSKIFKQKGILIITWDEGTGNSDRPIGAIVLSPFAKGQGFNNAMHYAHRDTLKTLEKIFHLRPLLRQAAHAHDLCHLFKGNHCPAA